MQITLLRHEPLNDQHLFGQAELFNHLLQQLQSGITQASLKQLVTDLRCKSPAPILSRLKHLEERGLIHVTQ